VPASAHSGPRPSSPRRRAPGGRPARARPAAFTLIELVLVLAIMAVIAAIAAPRYANSLARYRADLAARRIVADLELIQIRGRAQGTYESAEFHAGSDTYDMWSDPDLDDQTRQYRVCLGEAPYHADIIEAHFDSGTKNYMRYGNYGHPYWGGYVRLRVGDVERTVVVDADTGKAMVQ